MSGMMSTARRLQQALIMKGRNISINSRQFYSIKYERLVTCYKVKEDNKLLLKTYSTATLVQELAAMYKEASENDTEAD